MTKSKRALLKILLLTPKPLVWRFARTYIAGDTLDDAARTIRELNAEGVSATVDVLGEWVKNEGEVQFFVEDDPFCRRLCGVPQRQLFQAAATFPHRDASIENVLGSDGSINFKQTIGRWHFNFEVFYELLDQFVDVEVARLICEAGQ